MQSQSFSFERLEGRALFSAVLPNEALSAVPTNIASQVVTHAAASTPLAGAFNVSGTFTHPLGNPDTGSQYLFTGSGKSNALGTFTLKGFIRPPGFIVSARANGVVTITNAHGTLRLSLKGPQQGAGVLPPFTSFTVIRGTGAYANSTGKGKIVISSSTTTHKFLFKFNPPA